VNLVRPKTNIPGRKLEKPLFPPNPCEKLYSAHRIALDTTTAFREKDLKKNRECVDLAKPRSSNTSDASVEPLFSCFACLSFESFARC
jgi:hypothetical protein